ncbi:MAG: response regulator [Calditrichales bacterium]|nr:MAG: response regulator [Calditrichales bacterium]
MTETVRKLKILVVDDDPSMIKLISFYLSTQNCDITSVTRGAEALNILKTQGFDIIFIDVFMPEMDGYTLLKKMIGEYKIESPIIAVTAHGATDDLMRMITDGAYDILQKPFTGNRLKLTMRNALRYNSLLLKCKKLEKTAAQD